ncbi:MAG TPA: FIST N-terminal domain-containing protein [Burkholderiaceae bacterium]|nr:FIST N-terminal domain-containing protein [Burkholderiaceae bacterium]
MSSFFRHGHAADPGWRYATEVVLEQLDAQSREPGYAPGANLGLIYVTEELVDDLADIVGLLRERTGVQDWVGTIGHAIVATGREYRNEPAISVMLADLPAGSFHVFSGKQRPPAPGTLTGSGAYAAYSALVHADPTTPDLPELIHDMAGKVESGFVFGGLASGSTIPLPQVANQTLAGGLSGAVFSSEVELRTRVTQGCTPLAAEHVISDCTSNLIRALDGQPALDVLLADLGVEEPTRQSRDGERIIQSLPADRLRRGLFVGLAPRGEDRGIGFGDYRVRNLIGIDPQNRLVAVAAVPEAGDRAVFCTRDAQAARADLIRACTELREDLESESLTIRGGLYVSCVARGQALFGALSAEIELIAANLGRFPLVGFFANGEIARNNLYGYTGVLTLFVSR